MELYCLKCKKATESKDAQEVFYETKGRKMKRLAGVCSICGTKQSKILGKA